MAKNIKVALPEASAYTSGSASVIYNENASEWEAAQLQQLSLDVLRFAKKIPMNGIETIHRADINVSLYVIRTEENPRRRFYILE